MSRSLYIKFRIVFIFCAVFIVLFGVLNVRFVIANVQYYFLNEPLRVETVVSEGAMPIPVSPSASPVISDAVVPLANSNNESQMTEAVLRIDALGISAPIIFGSSTEESSIYKNLERGVVHYSETVLPGNDGGAVILGHSSAYPWYSGAYGSIFALLGKLKVGNTINVEYADGRVFTFVVSDKVIFNPLEDDSRIAGIQVSRPALVLVSCWPVGTAYKRIAVVAELVN